MISVTQTKGWLEQNVNGPKWEIEVRANATVFFESVPKQRFFVTGIANRFDDESWEIRIFLCKRGANILIAESVGNALSKGFELAIGQAQVYLNSMSAGFSTLLGDDAPSHVSEGDLTVLDSLKK